MRKGDKVHCSVVASSLIILLLGWCLEHDSRCVHHSLYMICNTGQTEHFGPGPGESMSGKLKEQAH